MLMVPGMVAAADNMTIITGPKTGTYYEFGKDIASVIHGKEMRIVVTPSEGSVQNIERLNQAGQPTLGIVQSDVLGFLGRSQNPESKQAVSQMRIMFPFYQEEVHVLAREEIMDFKDLQGKKVAIGEDGSGHMLTAVNLFSIEQIVPAEIKKIRAEEGIVAVLKGDLDAVIFVGGKPVKIFKNMEDLTKPENQRYALLLHHVHFLPLNNTKFYNEYEPTEITPQDYRFVKTIVPTIAVQALLVSYQPKSFTMASEDSTCTQRQLFAKKLRQQLPVLKKSGHPKWKEVTLSGDVVGWAKDDCIWPSTKAAQ